MMMSEKLLMPLTLQFVADKRNTFCSDESDTNGGMSSEPHERLKDARKAAGFETAEAFAHAVNVKPVTYRAHEQGTRGFSKYASKYARRLRTTAAWLISGESGGRLHNLVPIVGYVGAGAEVHPVDDYPKGQGMTEVEAPPGEDREIVAIAVKGDSMWPAYKDGDVIFYTRNGVSTECCIGKECIVAIEEGPTMLKTVTRGSQAERYTLNSYNAPPRENEKLSWASPVLWVKKAPSM